MSDKSFVLLVAVLAATSSFAARAQSALGELDFAVGETGMAYDPTKTVSWRGFLGAVLVGYDDPVADRNASLVPLVSISYRDTIYWHVGQGGVWLLKSDDRSARLGLAVKARGGYDPQDLDGLIGMDDRSTSIEAGLNALWWTQPVIVSFGYFTDVSNNSNGNSALLGISHQFRVSDAWALTPSVGAEWLSTEVVDYYYGVRTSEATPGRPAFAGQSSVNLRVAVMAYYRLARAWSLFGGASYTRMGAGISDSPIIVQDRVTSLFVGGGWRF